MANTTANHKKNLLPLYLQLYYHIRENILTGRWSPGMRLPSSRQMAHEWQMARETVKEAYELLQAEGFVVTKQGAGTFVSEQLAPLDLQTAVSRSSPLPLTSWGQHFTPSKRKPVPTASGNRPFIDFGFGRSFPHIFPYDIWRRLLGRYLSTDDMMLSQYGSVAGFYPLRQAIAAYVTEHRGVVCDAEQVVVVNGAQQALDLLARLFIEPGSSIILESPGYTDAYELFQAHQADVIPIPVDNHGLPVEKLPENLSPKLLFITPSNQFPRGGAMPAERRLNLLRWAEQRNAFIIEDDYDGALRYNGRPLSALQGIDPYQRVIYLGTFSKVLFPALRLAYVVLPPQLVEPFVKIKQLIDRGAPTLTQAAVADFMLEGHFVRHLRHLRHQYGELRQQMITAVETHLDGLVEFSSEPAGLHLLLYINNKINERKLIKDALKAGVRVSPGAQFHFESSPPPSILLGFSQLSQAEIDQGIRQLGPLIS